MTLTIELKPEVEARLREEADRSGLAPGAFAALALEESLRTSNEQAAHPAHLSHEESALLQKINQGLPENVWREYDELIARRRAETLSPDEHSRLIALSDRVEEAHAERMGYVAELARARNIPLKRLMDQMGIKARPSPDAPIPSNRR